MVFHWLVNDRFGRYVILFRIVIKGKNTVFKKNSAQLYIIGQ